MAEKDRMSLALAITGFTILSPEERAREIIRSSIWEDIDEHLEVGDLYRARAAIHFALRYTEEGNIFSFSQEDMDRLQTELTRVNREIDEYENASTELVVSEQDADK